MFAKALSWIWRGRIGTFIAIGLFALLPLSFLGVWLIVITTFSAAFYNSLGIGSQALSPFRKAFLLFGIWVLGGVLGHLKATAPRWFASLQLATSMMVAAKAVQFDLGSSRWLNGLLILGALYGLASGWDAFKKAPSRPQQANVA